MRAGPVRPDYLYAHVDEPAEEEHTQVGGVDDGQCGQVDAARHTAQVSTGENETRDDVADDADEDDDRHGDQVHRVHEAREVSVARVIVGAAVRRRTRRLVPRRRPATVGQQRRLDNRRRRHRGQSHFKSRRKVGVVDAIPTDRRRDCCR